MAPVPPLEIPIALRIPDPPEPTLFAEAGVTTSEWRAFVLYVKQFAVVGTTTVVGDLLAKLTLHVPSSTVDQVVNGLVVPGELWLGGLVVTWIIARTIRKKGTTDPAPPKVDPKPPTV